MWTDFDNQNTHAMQVAKNQINDFRLIGTGIGGVTKLDPQDTIDMHNIFTKKIIKWFKEDLTGTRIVITHHAPVINLNTKHASSPIQNAFNSLDMLDIIKEYKPSLWFYGHTHECDDQIINNTRVISNQMGYSKKAGEYECRDFCPQGFPITIK